MLALRGLGRYAPPITLNGFVRTTRAQYYGVGANLGLGAMSPAERLRLRRVGAGLGAPSSESHPEIIARAQQVYNNSGFSAACSETRTGWGPNGESYFNRLCALDGGPQSHAADPIAENYGDRLPQYMIDLVKGEVAAERAPGAAVVTPQGIYSVDQQGKPQTQTFYEALVNSGVTPAVAQNVAQAAAPAPVATPATPALSADPKVRVANAAKVQGEKLTYDQWNFYHKQVLGSYAPLPIESALPGTSRGALITIDQFWQGAYGAPAPTVPQSGVVPAGTPPAGSAGGSAGPVPIATQAPAVVAVTPGGTVFPSSGGAMVAADAGSVFTSSIFGVPVWMLAAGGVGFFLLSGRR